MSYYGWGFAILLAVLAARLAYVWYYSGTERE